MGPTTTSVECDTWTVLDDSTDNVRAVVSRESDSYVVRTEQGRELSRHLTIREAFDALPHAS